MASVFGRRSIRLQNLLKIQIQYKPAPISPSPSTYTCRPLSVFNTLPSPLPSSRSSHSTLRFRPSLCHPPPLMPVYRFSSRDRASSYAPSPRSDISIQDSSPFMASFDSIDGAHHSDANMIFDFDEFQPYEQKPAPGHHTWDTPAIDYAMPGSTPSSYLASPESTSSQLEFGSPTHMTPSDSTFDTNMMMAYGSTNDLAEAALYNNWISDPDSMSPLHTSSAPIDIPAQTPISDQLAYSDNSSIFPDVSPFSPTTAYAALQPLPRSFSPSSANLGDTVMTDALRTYPEPSTPASAGPDYHQMQMGTPSWATQLFTAPSQPQTHPFPSSPHLDVNTMSPSTSSMAIPFQVDGEDAFATQRPRAYSHRREIPSVSQMFHSSSAPSTSHMRAHPPVFSRPYTRRAESISESDDRDATIRRKRRSPTADEDEPRPAPSDREKSRKSIRFLNYLTSIVH